MSKKAEIYSSSILEMIASETPVIEEQKIRSKMLLAAKIADAIKEKGWSKARLAEEMGKQRSVVTKWLSGTHNFTCETLFEIEHLLEIKLIDLNEVENEQIAVYQLKVQGDKMVEGQHLNYSFLPSTMFSKSTKSNKVKI